MLVTFRSKAWSNITMFGDVAVTLLKMMGHSGTVPGAIRAADIPAAIKRLQQELANTGGEEKNGTENADDDEDTPPPVKLRHRAYPLIQLLIAASEQDCDVMWEKGASAV